MNALAFLFQYKRLRRSLRLETKSCDTKLKSEDDNENDDNQGSVGLFELLPLELKFHIFTFLSGTGISQVYFCMIMAALWNRAGHYIFALWFLLSSFLLA